MRYVFKFEYNCFAIYSGAISFSNWSFNRITDLIKFLIIALFKSQARSLTETNGEITSGVNADSQRAEETTSAWQSGSTEATAFQVTKAQEALPKVRRDYQENYHWNALLRRIFEAAIVQFQINCAHFELSWNHCVEDSSKVQIDAEFERECGRQTRW